MKKILKIMAISAGFALLLTVCAPISGETTDIEREIPDFNETALNSAPAAQLTAEPPEAPQNAAVSPVREMADALADQLSIKSGDGEAAIRTAYKYMIENIYFADPVGLDVWRYLSDSQAGSQESIPFIQNRSVSPFLFQIGSCEDFAAAMVMLLESAGFEAEYVAGYTVSVDHVYIDHAWAVVKLGDNWYHLDPQLEQNVTKQNMLTYRYYLKSDGEMFIDHKWGENLIEYWSSMPDFEKEAIRQSYTPPPCSESFAPPKAETVRKPLKPNMADVELKIRGIKKESGKGELPPVKLNVEPPVLVKQHHITPPLF